MNSLVKEKFDNIAGMISNTPLLEISYKYKGKQGRIFAKAEYYNLTGSIKDRVAFYIMKKAYEDNLIKQGDKIVEATSGNTGIAFCAMGTYLGHEVVIYMPDWMSKERINLMKSYGATVRLVSKEEGGFLGSIALAEESAKAGGVFLPRQFSNIENVNTHYYDTGNEISNQFKKLGIVPEALVAGVGTGGTVMGIAKRLKEDNPHFKAYPLEPENSPTLSTGYKVGAHRIQGISDEFIPDILKLQELSEVVSVDDTDAIIMAQMLSKKLGIGVGISSGANLLGSIIAQEKLGYNANVVTVFADDNKKYLSTDYCDEHQLKHEYLSHNVELLGFKSYR